MRLWRIGGITMEYLAMGSLLILCLELSLYALVNGGDVVSPSGYLWMTGTWGKCQGANCGFGGTQNRVTWCQFRENKETWTAKESDCDLMSRPQKERTCFKVCPIHSELFEWKVESWGPCERDGMELESPTSSDSCGEKSLGQQVRKIKCVEKSTSYVQMAHESFVDNEVCRELHREPVISQECITPCAQNCVVTEWSAWTECTSTCGNGTQTRTRRVVIPSSRDGWECPPLSQTQICQDIPSCNGEQQYTYSIKIGPWGECERFEAQDPEADDGSGGFPLIGMQRREVWCIQSDGAEVKMKKCISAERLAPANYQACMISQDCQVTDWTDWTPCPMSCPIPYGTDTYIPQDRPVSYRTRSRQVQMVPMGAGRLCPNLEERQPCRIEEGVSISSDDCPRYAWHSGGWSECSVSAVMSERQATEYANNSTLCGGGLHKRHVYCIKMNDTEFTPVRDELCESASRPPTTGECRVECPKDCKLSAWGPWSGCKTTSCSKQSYRREKGHRIRTRDILVQPDINGQQCEHLAEFVPCDIHMCYEWVIEPVEECIVPNAVCGEGKQRSRITCVGPDKEPIDEDFCTATISDEKPPSDQPCSIPCPDDCVVSEWGAWSECSQSCGKGGTEWRRRSILARNKPGAKECPLEEELTEKRLCNSHSCVVFAWIASEFAKCGLVNNMPASYNLPSHAVEGITCGTGRQARTLECVRVSNLKVSPHKRCSDLNKPPVSRQCHIPCPSDCKVSEFGEWSPCPTTCPEVKDEYEEQSRQRFILEHARSGGTICPALVEKKYCTKPDHCYEYKWIPGSWGVCKPVSEDNGIPRYNANDDKCGVGLHTREVACQRGDGYLYLDVDMCLQYSSPMPSPSEPCNLACDDDCQFKEWNRWTDCQFNCEGDQQRTRKRIGKSKRKDECRDETKHPLMEKRSCGCQEFNLVPVGRESDYPDCILETNQRGIVCGIGYMYRARQCQDEEGRIMPFSYCGDDAQEFLQSVCNVPCPYDCQLSPWSEWGECIQVEGNIGKRSRQRHIENLDMYRQNAEQLGRPCPAHDGEGYLYEHKPCEISNSSSTEYFWSTEMWQECHLDVNTVSENETCGGPGFQRRTVRCVMKNPSGFMGWTNHSMCDLGSRPEEMKECRKPCPGECVVSDWGEWSLCAADCNQVYFRSRTREIVREAPPGEDAACPELVEQKLCRLNENCFEYEWNVTSWSTCELKPGAVCGQGVMSRILQCKEKKDGGNVVDMKYCEERLPAYNQPLEGRCHVGCSIDCLLSDWSEWTKCSDVCGPEVGQSRMRTILREPSVLGRPCTDQLQQQRPCKAMPCFQWVMSEWSDCIPQDGDCGMGIRARNLSCVQNDGIVVEDSFCIGTKPYKSNFNVTREGMELLERTQLCSIPCPGECQYTQWSPWSKCHVYCHDDRPIGSEGIEARSKAALESFQAQACPGDVIETRPCNGQTCYEFTWQMGVWLLGHRDVWCQRIDINDITQKLNVTGACSTEGKPSADAICDPPCTIPHSYCSQTGECKCMNFYENKYSPTTGKLVDCEEPVRPQNPEETDSGPPYRNTDGSGDKEESNSENEDKSKSATNKKDEDKNSEAERNVFGTIPVWAFAIGGVFIVFILCLVVASCCACRSCRKKEDQPPKKKEPTADFNIYWDESAKQRYNGEVDL